MSHRGALVPGTVSVDCVDSAACGSSLRSLLVIGSAEQKGENGQQPRLLGLVIVPALGVISASMKLLIVLFLIAGLVWAVALMRRLPKQHTQSLSRSVVWLLLIGTVLGPASFAIEGPIQISVDRVFLALVCVAAVIQWRFGVLRLDRWQRVDIVLGLFTVYLLFKSLGGVPDEARVNPMGRWLFYVFVPLMVYTLARFSRCTRSDFRWMLNALIGLGLYLSVMAMFEVLGWHHLVFPRSIVDPTQWEFFGRGRGPLMNPIGNGFVISLGIAALTTRFLDVGRQGKMICLCCGVILMAGCYATLTRSCWIGAVGPLMIAGWVFGSRAIRALALVACVLAGMVLVTDTGRLLVREVVAMKRDQALSAKDAAKSVSLRPLLAIVAWEMFCDKPLVGHGFGQYFQHSQPYFSSRSYGLPLEQARGYEHHNTFLALLVDTGLIGLGLFLLAIAVVAARAWSMLRDPRRETAAKQMGLFFLCLFAAYLPNAVFHDMTIIPMVQTFVLAFAGFVVSVDDRGFAGQRNAEEPKLRLAMQ